VTRSSSSIPTRWRLRRTRNDLRAKGQSVDRCTAPCPAQDNIRTRRQDADRPARSRWWKAGAAGLHHRRQPARRRRGHPGKTNSPSGRNFRSFDRQRLVGRGGPDEQPYGINSQPVRIQLGSGPRRRRTSRSSRWALRRTVSIVCPGNANGVVALKPTVGLNQPRRRGTISHVQDTVGPHTRTVAARRRRWA